MPYPIIISSANQNSSLSTSNSNFGVKLQTNYFVDKVRFKKIILPFSWYPIDSTNNTGLLKEGAGANLAFTVATPTTWTGTDLATALQTALNAAGGANTYTVSYNVSTLKYTISRATGTSTFGIQWATSGNTLNKIFGFNLVNDTQGTSQISPNVGYALGFPYVIIKSVSLTSQVVDKTQGFYGTTTSGGSSEVLVSGNQIVYIMVPVSVGFGGTIILMEGESGIKEINYSTGIGRGNQLLQQIDFQVINPWTNATINLNGADWIIELEAETKTDH